RLKAGTATKLVLNMLSTISMIKIGKVYNNLMVDLQSSNAKLTDRGIRIIMEVTGTDFDTAQETLTHAGGSVKTAI
ncbi:MAG: N-acetylmuramic acid 6-phosphate etherase, partial [Candidatus Poribacteria bacterium]|nr:N-acetylmuramic acid 6-phosphate etherase [Candidatus Poribacteria bacterium]